MYITNDEMSNAIAKTMHQIRCRIAYTKPIIGKPMGLPPLSGVSHKIPAEWLAFSANRKSAVVPLHDDVMAWKRFPFYWQRWSWYSRHTGSLMGNCISFVIRMDELLNIQLVILYTISSMWRNDKLIYNRGKLCTMAITSKSIACNNCVRNGLNIQPENYQTV